MKKSIAMALCTVMALSLATCSNDKPEAKDDSKQQSIGVEISSPFVDCETIADAEKLVGFTVTFPSVMPGGYVQKSIEAIENSDNGIVIR